MSEKYAAPAVTKMLDIVELLAGQGGGLSLNEIARRTGNSINSVYRICLELENRGYLVKDLFSGTYDLGLKFQRIGEAAASRMELRRYALPYLHRLRDKCGETAHLCIRQGERMVLLEQVETQQPIRIHVDTGAVMYLHASAFGKCMLAYLEQEDWNELCRNTLEKLTPNTITQWEQLERECFAIRTEGVGYDREEYMLGVSCVGAPILGRDGRALGAMGLMAPSYRFSQTVQRRTAALVLEAAGELSEHLGWRRPDSQQKPETLKKE